MQNADFEAGCGRLLVLFGRRRIRGAAAPGCQDRRPKREDREVCRDDSSPTTARDVHGFAFPSAKKRLAGYRPVCLKKTRRGRYRQRLAVRRMTALNRDVRHSSEIHLNAREPLRRLLMGPEENRFLFVSSDRRRFPNGGPRSSNPLGSRPPWPLMSGSAPI